MFSRIDSQFIVAEYLNIKFELFKPICGSNRGNGYQNKSIRVSLLKLLSIIVMTA